MNQQYLSQETFHAILLPMIAQMHDEYIIDINEEELVHEQYELLLERNTPYQDFFRDSTITTSHKLKVMCMMSRDNLKFHQLNNVDDSDQEQFNRLLIDMFSSSASRTTEDNTFTMIHVLACVVNKKTDNVIANIFDTSEGRSIFTERMDDERTVLHYAFRYNASMEFINRLIDIGGRELVIAADTHGNTVIHEACQMNASIEFINRLIDIGGRELVIATNTNGYNALHTVCHYNASIETINALIDVGGRELVMTTDTDGMTALHTACHYNIPIETINRLINVGGRELVIATNTNGYNALHTACRYNTSIESINRLIDIGGRELVIATHTNGYNALHTACHYNASIETINRLIAIGGRELVIATNTNGRTALHEACHYNASIETINALIDIGERELVIATNTNGRTALHEACQMNASIETINTLIYIGGRELLIVNDNQGNFPLVTLLLTSYGLSNKTNKLYSLISSGIIQDQGGGEFGIGGLFNFASEEGQQSIFEHWNNIILPALEMNTDLISRQPILQAAIIARAPLQIIQDIISRFDCIATQDSRGRYPIDVAVVEGLIWDDGMEDIVREHTTASIAHWQGQAQLMINVAALHGLKWENGMEKVADESREEVGNADALTGLFPFMLAAAGNSSDLSSIYELMLLQSPAFFKDSCKHKGNEDINNAMISKKRRLDG